MKYNKVALFGQFARALSHNGALSPEEAEGCSSLRAANALMRAHGINYNDALPRDQKWRAGKEGWNDTEDGGVSHTTASGRLSVTFRGQGGFDTLEFESAETNDFGNHLVARLLLLQEDGEVACFSETVSNLLEGRPDRIELLRKLDTTGELVASLRRLASRQVSRSREAGLIVAAIDALAVQEKEVIL